MRALSILLRVVLAVLAAGLAAAALGAFASLNPASPTWLRTLSALEGLLLVRAWPAAYPRGLVEAGLSALGIFLAAWPLPPRRQKLGIDQHYQP